MAAAVADKLDKTRANTRSPNHDRPPSRPTDASAALDTLAGWLASARHVAVLTAPA